MSFLVGALLAFFLANGVCIYTSFTIAMVAPVIKAIMLDSYPGLFFDAPFTKLY